MSSSLYRQFWRAIELQSLVITRKITYRAIGTLSGLTKWFMMSKQSSLTYRVRRFLTLVGSSPESIVQKTSLYKASGTTYQCHFRCRLHRCLVKPSHEHRIVLGATSYSLSTSVTVAEVIVAVLETKLSDNLCYKRKKAYSP